MEKKKKKSGQNDKNYPLVVHETYLHFKNMKNHLKKININIFHLVLFKMFEISFFFFARKYFEK